MTRTNRGPRNANTAATRRSEISRSLSKLLRHQAENEKVPISAAGWVKLDDLLAWRGLGRIGKDITITEIFEVVEEDGRTGKGRFGVKRVEGQDESVVDDREQHSGTVDIDAAATSDMVEATSSLSVQDSQIPARQEPSNSQQQAPLNPSSKNTPETQSALHHYHTHPNDSPSQYLIRATQGHSIHSITSTDIFTPLTLTTASLPSTVVHGTFYGAWASILATGGLKPMGRNNVHFATGPSLDEVLTITGDDPSAMKQKGQVDEVLSQNKVISGMRWDAQLLIYVDLRRCLEDVAARKLDMTWWLSGNGVVLTEGVVETGQGVDDDDEQGQDQGQGMGELVVASKQAKVQKERENLQSARKGKQRVGEKIVPMKYWSVVVEIKNGVGVIWKQGEGVVKELPERLRNTPLPRGKGRVHGARGGRGGKPRLNVERGGERDVIDDEAEGE